MMTRINDSSVWRSFEDASLTHSAAHYLTAVLRLRQEQGYARVTDVAERLRISRGAASRAISILKERGWVCEDPHRMLELTSDGQTLAHEIEHNFVILESFLQEILGVPHEVAHEDACKMEHLLNPVTTEALTGLINLLGAEPELMERLRRQLAADGAGLAHTAGHDDEQTPRGE